MKNRIKFLFAAQLFILIGCQTKSNQKAEVICLHPENPNYFLFQGKPTILITSGEHYGAVMNTDFNYQKYLQTLG